MLSLLLLMQVYTWTPEIDRKDNWKQFGDWEVFVGQKEFDTEPIVITRTIVLLDSKDRQGKQVMRTFGFRIFGKNYYRLETGIEGKGTWPDCDYDLTKYAVDGKRASFFPTSGGGGACEHVGNGKWINEFGYGNTVRIAVNDEAATASLKGFTAAWSYALKKSH